MYKAKDHHTQPLFKELEDLTYKHLIRQKIIKAKGLLAANLKTAASKV